jgi:hypothetical protein
LRGRILKPCPARVDQNVMPPHLATFAHAAAGPMPWGRFAQLALPWTLLTWASAAFLGLVPTLLLVVAGIGFFFYSLPRDAPFRLIPGRAGWALGVAFFGGLIVAAYTTELEVHLVGPAGALWLVCWVQLALWVRDRFGDDLAIPIEPQPPDYVVRPAPLPVATEPSQGGTPKRSRPGSAR